MEAGEDGDSSGITRAQVAKLEAGNSPEAAIVARQVAQTLIVHQATMSETLVSRWGKALAKRTSCRTNATTLEQCHTRTYDLRRLVTATSVSVGQASPLNE
jgi:hypothetical protein